MRRAAERPWSRVSNATGVRRISRSPNVRGLFVGDRVLELRVDVRRAPDREAGQRRVGVRERPDAVPRVPYAFTSRRAIASSPMRVDGARSPRPGRACRRQQRERSRSGTATVVGPSARSTASTTCAAIARYVVSLPPVTRTSPGALSTMLCSREALLGAPVAARRGERTDTGPRRHDVALAKVRVGEVVIRRVQQVAHVGRARVHVVRRRRVVRVGRADDRERSPPAARTSRGRPVARSASPPRRCRSGRAARSRARPCCRARWRGVRVARAGRSRRSMVPSRSRRRARARSRSRSSTSLHDGAGDSRRHRVRSPVTAA